MKSTTSTHDNLIARVKSAVTLAEIVDTLGLRRRGRSVQCPNQQAHKHGDRTMSAWISASGKSWRCYGCQTAGTVLDFMMAARGYDMQQAALALADYAGLPPPAYDRSPFRPSPAPPVAIRPPAIAEPPPPASPETAAFLRESQERIRHSDHARDYLTKRGIPLAIAIEAGLGFAPRGTWPNSRGSRQPRIVAPLTTPGGALLTLYGRSTVMCEKSLRHDFLPGAKGIFHAASLKEDRVILVEGVFDALACLAGGLPCSGLCGLNMREHWWDAIQAKRTILAVDGDEAGKRGWTALADSATARKKEVYYLKPEALGGHKDLSAYWTASRTLPPALRRAMKTAAPN